jgi:DNA-binding NtrC family response regulator
VTAADRGLRRVRVLAVDDEPDVLLGLERLISTLGVEVATARSAPEALAALAARPTDILVTDVRMPGMTGVELLREALRRWPRIATVVLTGYGTIELAVQCLQLGAAHFLAKPFENAEILSVVERLARAAAAHHAAAAGAASEAGRDLVVAVDAKMREVLALVDQVAPSPLPVLIEGPSGTGKELIARRIHARSGVRGKPFLAINTAALPDTLLESELFGHRRGAFTGADRDRAGIFKEAAGGTVFLDEVASMSMPFQAKLLRVLQEKVVRPLGAAQDEPVDFRLIAATNRDLGLMAARGAFREDLLYRLRVISIRLPPLRERVADIPELAALFLARAAASCLPPGAPVPQLSPAALDELCRYPFPGNVRQLENTIQRAVVVCRGPRILPHHLGLQEPGLEGGAAAAAGGESYEEKKKAAIERFQREFVARALERTGGNVSRAAESCGLTRAAFQKIMRGLEIDRTSYCEPP